jgi:hypothetical protein
MVPGSTAVDRSRGAYAAIASWIMTREVHRHSSPTVVLAFREFVLCDCFARGKGPWRVETSRSQERSYDQQSRSDSDDILQ